MIHITFNMGSWDLPDMYIPSALGPAALGLYAYISGKSLLPMLQLIHVYWAITSYYPGNNYHIHPVFNFDLPRHWGRRCVYHMVTCVGG